jgi:hypothetical protein
MAANIRIMYENLADTASSLIASSTAGSLVASNLLSDIRTRVHRSTATTVSYTLQWPVAKIVNMAAVAFTNLTSTATMRVRCYTEPTDSIPVLDTGNVLACGYVPLGLFGWGAQPIGVNAFRYVGGAYGRVYFALTSCKMMVVTLDDPTNSMGYIEASRLITGSYWEPDSNPGWGLELKAHYDSEHEISEAGDVRTERRAIRRGLEMELSWIKSEIDQQRFYELMIGTGKNRPIFVSLFPMAANPALEQRFQMYAKLLGDLSLSHPKFGLFTAPVSMMEI